MSIFKEILIGGFCLSSLHVIWVLLIAISWAQPLMDFVFKLHMLNSPFQVQAFNVTYAIGLISFTFFIGCFYVLMFYAIKRIISK